MKKIFLLCVMLLAFPVGVSAHGVFMRTESPWLEAAGQSVDVSIMFGHYPWPDGDLVTSGARIFVVRPDGSEQDLGYETMESPEGEYVNVRFTPQTAGLYRVVYHRGTATRSDLAKAYILVGGGAVSPVGVTNTGRLEIQPTSDIGRLTPNSVFEGVLLFGGGTVPNHRVSIEVGEDNLTHAETDADGRFSITMPNTAGTFTIMTTGQLDDLRDEHSLMVFVTDSPLPVVAEEETEEPEEPAEIEDEITEDLEEEIEEEIEEDLAEEIEEAEYVGIVAIFDDLEELFDDATDDIDPIFADSTVELDDTDDTDEQEIAELTPLPGRVPMEPDVPAESTYLEIQAIDPRVDPVALAEPIATAEDHGSGNATRMIAAIAAVIVVGGGIAAFLIKKRR
ncbi:MAG: DUF4198 domain-containing protein [Defluviitaleaceae bacterium]|nr:DUF4198 domain-containing protein [Defluviitaleaceae bacterium]MCL2262916.1 DUF4198 domain-containing protein [Defluviitaleaceae bacterium]